MSREHIDGYHRWYYESQVYLRTTFLGVPCLKFVSDLWNYQEILYERKPSLVVEFGTHAGGSALFFSNVLQAISSVSRVLSVDRDRAPLAHVVRDDPRIELLTASSTDPIVAQRISSLRTDFPGPMFAILDSDHRQEHVLAEMISLRPLLIPGDYIVVEDGNLNGHPVFPNWGAGPFEAIAEYDRRFPEDFEHDVAREQKFGFTCAPRGFLVKRCGK